MDRDVYAKLIAKIKQLEDVVNGAIKLEKVDLTSTQTIPANGAKELSLSDFEYTIPEGKELIAISGAYTGTNNVCLTGFLSRATGAVIFMKNNTNADTESTVRVSLLLKS